MIRIITRENEAKHHKTLKACFQLRHKVFVKELGWKDLNNADNCEIDQFDTDDAVHIVVMDGERPVGYSRLLPSTKPHLLSEVFPHLATRNPIPKGPDTFEWTRYCVASSHRGGSAISKTASELIYGVLEYCTANNISSLTAVYEAVWITRFLELGFDVTPLGLPDHQDKHMIVGVHMKIVEHTMDITRTMRNLDTTMPRARSRQIESI